MLQRFLQLLVWVRERPEDYCSHLGELADILHQLYDLCAAADGNTHGLNASLSELLTKHKTPHVNALLTDAERASAFQKGDATAARLIAFWTVMDQTLGFPSPLPVAYG